MGSGEAHWRRVDELEAKGRAGDRAAVPSLLEVLEDGARECWHTRTAAIRSLAALGEGGAAILKTLARDDDPDVREAAIDALAALRFHQATRLLRQIAASDEDPLRQRAHTALQRIQSI